MDAIVNCVVTIQNKKGLHARAAAKFVKVASAFSSQITATRLPRDEDGVIDLDWVVPARSILGLMMLGAEPGTKIRIEASGEDAQAAIDALVVLVNDRFDEGE